jgi:gamma-polyglutamate synthase
LLSTQVGFWCSKKYTPCCIIDTFFEGIDFQKERKVLSLIYFERQLFFYYPLPITYYPLPNMLFKTARSLLEEDIPPLWLKVEAKLIKTLQKEYRQWLTKKADEFEIRQKITEQSTQTRQRLAISLIKFLTETLNQELAKITTRQQQYTKFNQNYSQAINIKEQRQLILEFAKALGATQRQLREDEKAFSRWFGQDAMIARYHRLVGLSERRIVFLLKRIGFLANLVLDDKDKVGKLWRSLNLEKYIQPLLHYAGDSRISLEAFHCLATALKKKPAYFKEQNISSTTLQYIYRASLDYRQNVWIQCQAIQLLATLSPQTLLVVLEKRFQMQGLSSVDTERSELMASQQNTTPENSTISEESEELQKINRDDFFVRQRAVQIISNHLQDLPELIEFIPIIAQDRSPFVRQALAKALAQAPTEILQRHLRQLALQDQVAPVRAAALLEIPILLPRIELHDFLLQLLVESLTNETEHFVLRVALKVATDSNQILSEESDWIVEHQSKLNIQHWQQTLLTEIEKIHCAIDKPIPLRRLAAQVAEQIWCAMEPNACALQKHFKEQLRVKKMGPHYSITNQLLPIHDTLLARVLSVISQNHFGYDVVKKWFSKTIIQGHLFPIRLWRILYEFFHPDPSKRQGFQHTIGRHFPGQIHIPSSILSELAETKVPGEPLFIANEGGWRPYLPLVDEMIDCLNHPMVQIYSSEGITTLKRPKSWWHRQKAYWKLVWYFADYAKLRNWNEQNQSAASTYIKALQNLGFQIDYQTHTYPNLSEFRADPAVQRFFPLFLPFGVGEIEISDFKEFWLNIQEYFFSVYQNSLEELGFFAAAVLVFFFSKHVHSNQLVNNARANIPLVIGGWGTRGKSGTERIKAALFNALGYSVFSKTTGCEAMFLHANPYDITREIFLFRPYDKATIWEHYNLLLLADKMDTDIFLWECMGLTPAYVEVLQKQWTRDDISTITNTYPDHEDLQGPAGINIPQVMTNFIPRHATLITTEEQMLPILQTAANQFHTRLHPVTWLQAGLLTPDVLERFPYEEHPYNIALVLGLAEELDIPTDFALKEMADRVVLDLGVLKTYPAAPIKTRQLEFVMGMSANERFGALGNWTRMGFRDHDPEKEPQIWLTTVVNNRADRIARSRVFASILVEDIRADQHFLIGTNLTGFLGYIRESWESYVAKQTLWSKPESALNRLRAAARTYRIPITKEQIQVRLRIMLGERGKEKGERGKEKAELETENSTIESLLNLWEQPQKLYESLPETVDADNAKAILERLETDIKNYQAYQALAQQLEKATDSQHDEFNKIFHQLLWQWFESKLVVIHNPQISGDQMIKRICTATPPGFFNRMMGMQNIKGTGLDFVYRWQAWETCYKATNQLKSTHSPIVEQGLNTLVSFQEFGPLCAEYVHQTITQIQTTPIGQKPHFQSQLTRILNNLQLAMHEINAQSGEAGEKKNGLFQKWLFYVEKLLDAGDAIKRRKIADQIYKDMANGRISYQTAALEIQKLNKRQKGGWLSATIANWQR